MKIPRKGLQDRATFRLAFFVYLNTSLYDHGDGTPLRKPDEWCTIVFWYFVQQVFPPHFWSLQTWLQFGSILAAYLLEYGCRLAGSWLEICFSNSLHNCLVLAVYWLHIDCILTANWLEIGCILAANWLHIGCILAVFLLVIDCILAAQWLHFNCI